MAKTISERLKKLFDILGIRLYTSLQRASSSCWGPLCQFDLQVYLIAVPIIYFYGVFFSFSRAAAGSQCFILLSRLETLTSTSTERRVRGRGGGAPALWAHRAAWLCSSSSVRVKAAHLWFNLQRGLSQITLCNSTIATNLPAPSAARSSKFLHRYTKSSTFSGC